MQNMQYYKMNGIFPVFSIAEEQLFCFIVFHFFRLVMYTCWNYEQSRTLPLQELQRFNQVLESSVRCTSTYYKTYISLNNENFEKEDITIWLLLAVSPWRLNVIGP